jgi:putative transposase
MRKGRFSQEQIINVLKEHQAGISVVELCRKHGISDATFYTWRTKYGGMEVSDAGSGREPHLLRSKPGYSMTRTGRAGLLRR